MNTNSNTYTVIYSTILVVVVAAVLAFASTALKGKQEENVKVDTVSQILTAAGFKAENNVLETYIEHIEAAILVNAEGVEVGVLNTENVKDLQVYGNSELKAQIGASEQKLPVYIFDNGVTVVPCYGAGLWGPIWGYIGVQSDLTITKACFGHKGETPGLGAKITDEPAAFADNFTNKTITAAINVSKNVTGENDVNAISGATITSTAAGVMVNQWLGFYQGYFTENADECCEDACCTEECCEGTCCEDTEQCCEGECCESVETVEESNN